MLCSRWGFRCRCACLIAPVYILDLFHCKGSALALVHGCTSIWMMLVFCYRFVMMEKGKQGKTRQGKPTERKARQGKERQGKEKGHRELCFFYMSCSPSAWFACLFMTQYSCIRVVCGSTLMSEAICMQYVLLA